jgi:O-antigen ligase
MIDATWQQSVMGINALRILGVLFPIAIICRYLADHCKFPLLWVWFIYMLSNIGGFSLILLKGDLLESANFLFRILNGFVGFYLFQSYFDDEIRFRRLLIVFMLAGLFPMLMGVTQAIVGGEIWYHQETIGLIRNVGIYNDAVSFRYYGQMTITAIILYMAYFLRKDTWHKWALLLYGCVCLFVLYKTYSKAAIVIITLWYLIWCVANKKILWFVAAPMLIFVIDLATFGKISNSLIVLFSKETAVIEGTGKSMKLFAGRPYIWIQMLQEWMQADIVAQLFGLGKAGGGTHNDYLRVLLSSGLFGIVSYIMLLVVIGYRVVRNALLENTPLNIMAFMIFVAWLVDTIGLQPGLYPAYQWYVWGFIGLSIKGLREKEENRSMVV